MKRKRTSEGSAVRVRHGGVTVERAPLCADEAGSVPVAQWPILLNERKRFCEIWLPRDCALLLFFIDDAEANGWLGFQSREDYIRSGLGIDPAVVEWAALGRDLIQEAKKDERISAKPPD